MLGFDIIDGFKELINNIGNNIVNGQILENLILLNSFGISDVDSFIINNISEEQDNNMIMDFILDRLAKVSNMVLTNRGISISTDTLDNYNKVLSVLALVNNVDDNHAKVVLTILEDETKDNIEILATLISTYSDTRYVDAFEMINYYKDTYKNLLIDTLNEKVTSLTSSDLEGVDKAFKLIKLLLSISKEMAKSDVCIRLINGKPIITKFKYYLNLVKNLNLNDPVDESLFEVNIATGLFFSTDTKNDIIDNLSEYITNDYLENVTNKDKILEVILGYLKKMKDGVDNDD